jgi:hypothetical protein
MCRFDCPYTKQQGAVFPGEGTAGISLGAIIRTAQPVPSGLPPAPEQRRKSCVVSGVVVRRRAQA